MSGKEQIYECPECRMHYRNQEIAKQCEEFCKTHKMCNLEITKHSLEHEPKAECDEG